MDKKETPHITVEGVAEAIAHATDGMSQSVEAMHRIEDILDHYAAHIVALKDAEWNKKMEENAKWAQERIAHYQAESLKWERAHLECCEVIQAQKRLEREIREEKDAELEQCREALVNTRITSTNAMNEIRAAAGAPQSQDDKSQKRAVDYVIELRRQFIAAQEDSKRLDCGEIILTVHGEQTHHHQVDLRAAIDATRKTS